MKNQTLIAIAAVLVIVLGIQAYMTFQLHKRLNQLSGQNQTGSYAIKLPNSPKTILPKPDKEGEFFKDRLWDPYEEVQRMQNEMEQVFNKSLSRFHMNKPLENLSKTPEVDLQEKPDSYSVTVNAPGADESSIAVNLENQVLHISVKTERAKDETDENKGKYQYRERFVGMFQRVLTLPGPADAAKMKTEYRNGVLTITIPKA